MDTCSKNKYCYKDLMIRCKKGECSRWASGVGDEPGECMSNIQTRFIVRLLNSVRIAIDAIVVK